MNNCLVLGLGRSGTTLLSRLLATTPTPCRFISEPLPGLAIPLAPGRENPSFTNPLDASETDKLLDVIQTLGSLEVPLGSEQGFRIERNDENGEVLLVKEVHSLLSYPVIADRLKCKVVLITRDISRVTDSFFFGHDKRNRRYLKDEFHFFKSYMSGKFRAKMPILEEALDSLPDDLIGYIKRPNLFTDEILRWAATAIVMNAYLRAWAKHSEYVVVVSFENLCKHPNEVCEKVFSTVGLDYDSATAARIKEMTTGSETEYYATSKNSRAILKQSYKVLSSRHEKRIKIWTKGI